VEQLLTSQVKGVTQCRKCFSIYWSRFSRYT